MLEELGLVEQRDKTTCEVKDADVSIRSLNWQFAARPVAFR
jgi:hypothetical protein